MAQDTTSETGAKAVSPKSQQRENVDPTERNQPIPLLAAVAMVVIVLFGAGYIVFSDAPGAPELGDRRTVDDLRSGGVKAAGSVDGKQLFTVHCVACHQASGKGLPGVFPPLDASEWVVGDERIVANILLHGIAGEITVAGTVYKGVMPAFKQLSDAELAAMASYTRGEWSNKAAPIKAELFERERKANARTTAFAGGDELKALATKTP